MDMLNELYYKTLTESQRNLCFWEDYLQNLKSLDFNVYSEKLKVPVLVPIGSRLMFRGELKHTNEVTVALGADYFVKCSLKQADILRQHRIKVAQEKVDAYIKEKDYLEKRMSFTQQNVYDNEGKEIIEYHTEEEDKVWRLKHKQNVKEYMQKKSKKEDVNQKDTITDDELWERLEELELQEELENELNSLNDDSVSLSKIKERSLEPFVVKEEEYINFKDTKDEKKDEMKSEKEVKNKNVIFKEIETPHPSKLDLLQQVIDRQNELDQKLLELKNKERSQSKTEKDLISRLDELEQLDELEDEMDRLDDIIDNENVEESEEEELSESDTPNLQRRVSFVDQDNSETINIIFKHSEVEPDTEPYNPDKGIQKPSDIYKAHSNLFGSGVTSILKKSKYSKEVDVAEVFTKEPVIKETKIQQPVEEISEVVAPKTVVLKDIVERIDQDDNKLQTEIKPMSLFKKKRMQNKSQCKLYL